MRLTLCTSSAGGPPLTPLVGHRNVIAGVAGITSDANSLVNYARTVAQKYLLQYNQDIPVEQLAQRLCDMKQGYTQYGGTSTLPRACFVPCTALPPFQVFVRLASHSSMRDMTHTIASNSTIRILRGTILDGKQPASAQTVGRPRVFSNKSTKTILVSRRRSGSF